MSYRDKGILSTFAKLASDEYLRGSHSLNTAIKKIAKDEHLTPDQIEFVSTTANQLTWSKLFSQDKTASYDFPMANSAEVIKDLQIKPEQKVVDNAAFDYMSAPKATKTASFDVLAVMGFQKEAVDNTCAKRELKHVLQNRMEKIALAKERIHGDLIIAQGEIADLEEKFVKAARTMVLEVPLEERGKTVEKIAEFVACCGDHAKGRNLMKKFAHVLKRQGIVKTADLKAPEEYISDKLPARIVNGKHELYVTVKTLFDKFDYASNMLHRYEIVDSSLPPIREKIREL